MKKQNIDGAIKRYERAHRVTDELLSAIDNGGDVSGSDALNEFIENDPQGAELIERLTSEERYSQFIATVDGMDRVSDTQRLVRRLEFARDKKRINRRVLVVSISSCAAALLLSLWIFSGVDNSSERSTIIANEINSEITEPTLILDNGERVPLSQLSGDVQMDNMVVSKGSDRRLSYVKTLGSASENETVKYNTLIMPAKSTHVLVLGDGTEIHLNAGSKLTYPIGVHSDSREVELEGEAYFHVKKSSKPFIVRVGGSRVKVYGTEFNLRNTMGEIETVLIEGSVGFTAEDNKEQMMSPNQKLVYNKDRKERVLGAVNGEDYLLWQHNFFAAKGQTLRRVFYDISSWYGVTITAPDKLMDMELTLVQPRGDTAENVLNFIAEIMNVKLIVERKGEYRIE